MNTLSSLTNKNLSASLVGQINHSIRTNELLEKIKEKKRYLLG